MSLPNDFLWGFGTASYQIEGASEEGGRGSSIWDTFCNTPGKIVDGSSGTVACNSYHLTADDITLLKSLGAKAYRFSISWSRIIPLGGRADPINSKGLQHYVQFVDDLIDAGIIPMVTLYQWDLPQKLQDRYGGLLDKDEFVADFSNYARIVFKALSPKVKHWMTFTEPWNISISGYVTGVYAPGRCSDREKSPVGDSAREGWIVGHNILIAHGAAVKIYREEFKSWTNGEIGLTVNGEWAKPWDATDPEDQIACERYLDFSIGWFIDPIYHGKYPDAMVKQLGNRLPAWTAEDVALVKGSNDFFGLDYYTSSYIKHKDAEPAATDYNGNTELSKYNFLDQSIGVPSGCSWLHCYPEGLRALLNWVSDRCGRPKIYVVEQGTSVVDEDKLSRQDMLRDTFRCESYRKHIEAMVQARCEDGVNVMAFLAWSLLDNFEWNDGYRVRFGVTYVDFENDHERYPKDSAKLIGELMRGYMADEH